MKTTGRMERAASSGVAGVIAPRRARISLHWLLQVVLMCTFVMGLEQYSLSSNTAAFLPLIGIALSALLVLLGRRRAARLQNILGGGGCCSRRCSSEKQSPIPRTIRIRNFTVWYFLEYFFAQG